jgi:hypothetical protein
VSSSKGLVEDSVSAETIDCIVTSIFPTTLMNAIGGDNITISGSNFPRDLNQNSVVIKFDNGMSTKCIPQESSSTRLVCMTEKFDKVADLG